MKSARWVTLAAVDTDKAACAVYAANFPSVDVQCCRVENASMPPADVILAGFPCQPHSFAGERKASADERDGGDAFVEAIARVRPRMFLGENVDGILSSEAGRYVARLVSKMEAIGYRVQVKALDAVDFGVPQFRNRVWFWGIRNDVEAVHRWPTRTHMDPAKRGALFGDDLPPWVSCGDALGLCVYDMQNEKNIGDDRPCGTLQGTAQEKGGDAGHYAIHRMSGPNSEEAKYGDHPCTEPCPTVSIPSGGKCGLSIRRARGESVDRPDHPTTEPCPTIGDGSGGSGGSGGVLRVVGQVSHADDARPIDAPASTLRAGGKGHDSCCVRIVGGGTNPRGSGGERTTRDITDEPSPTIPVDAGNAVSEYRYSEAMYAKHAPAAPAPTVQAKWYKGGAEGLVMAPSADGRPWDSRHPVASPPAPAPAIRARSPRDGGRCTENVVVVPGPHLPTTTIFGEPVKWIRKGPCLACDVLGGTQKTSASGPLDDCHVAAKHGQSPGGPRAYGSKHVKMLWTLRKYVGEEAFREWCLGVRESNARTDLLHTRLHEEGVFGEGYRSSHELVGCSRGRPESGTEGAMRAMREAGRARRTPQEWGLDRQLQTKLGAYLSLLSHQGPQADHAMSALLVASQEQRGVLQKASSQIQAVGGCEDGKGQPAHTCRHMRRLTVLECARLQSVPDDFVWPDSVSKSSRYRIIGNGVACGIAVHLSRALAEADPKSRTVLDLFCGGGLWACGWHGRSWTHTEAQ